MEIKYTSQIASKIYEDSLKIRTAVFVIEQKVHREIEVDALEDVCNYYVGYFNKIPITTARTFVTKQNGLHIQRVATLKNYRHQNYAKKLLNFIEKQAKKQNLDYLILGAQDQAQEFYIKLGFKVIGNQFLDAGIKHHNMIKKINKKESSN